MRIEILMQAQFWMALTREDLEPLFILSQHHYDGVYRAAGVQGGFLYGWRNQVSAHVPANSDSPLCQGSRRDLDTLLKICEGTRVAASCKLITPEQERRVNQLCALVWTALSEGTRAAFEFKPVHVLEPDKKASLQWATAQGRH